MMKGCEAHLPKTEEPEITEKQENPERPENPGNPEPPEKPQNAENTLPPIMPMNSIRDTIRGINPNTVNIQEVYEQKVEVKE